MDQFAGWAMTVSVRRGDSSAGERRMGFAIEGLSQRSLM